MACTRAATHRIIACAKIGHITAAQHVKHLGRSIGHNPDKNHYRL